ncbi:MAG: hypothetical protein ACI9N1_003062 [Flavobacteriales bacterium]|jgi:hypothetical protein
MNIFRLAITAIFVSCASVALSQNTENTGKKEETIKAKEIIAKPVVNPAVLKPITKTNVKAEKVAPQKVNVTAPKAEALAPEKK